jgi:hypothetical protein
LRRHSKISFFQTLPRLGRHIRLWQAFTATFIILASLAPFEFFHAVGALAKAAWDPSVLLVISLAVIFYLAVALFKDPIGTAIAFAALMLPIQEWRRGGAVTRWLQNRTWRINVWLDYRRKLENALHSRSQDVQVAALHRVVANKSSPGKKLSEIEKIRSHAAAEEVQTAAGEVARIVKDQAKKRR